jgi:hypothetical protein
MLGGVLISSLRSVYSVATVFLSLLLLTGQVHRVAPQFYLSLAFVAVLLLVHSSYLIVEPYSINFL